MTSYDVGYLFGYMLAVKWLRKALALPEMDAMLHTAQDAYREKSKLFDIASKQDFLEGFTDSMYAAYKGETLSVA